MSQNNNTNNTKPSFEEYAEAIFKILKLVQIMNQLTRYYNLNQIATQYFNTTFTPIQQQKLVNYFGVQYQNLPNVAKQIQYNPIALVTQAQQLAEQIQPNVINQLASVYNLEPSIVKALQIYVAIAQILPRVVSNTTAQVVNNNQYSPQNPTVLENYY